MSTNSLVRKRFQAALRQQHLAVGGLSGLLLLSNLFKKIDVDNTGYLSWDEFCSGLQQCGLTPSSRDIRALFLVLDKDANNRITYNEFVVAMREEMSDARKAVISKVFSIIDSDRDGVISMTDIGRHYNPKSHPDVRSGRITVSKMSSEFFECINTATDTGYLSLAQFMEYYGNAAAFDDDAKFNTQMKAIWNLSLPTVKTNGTYGDTAVAGLFESSTAGVARNVDLLREQLLSRGVRGVVGLHRKFRAMDEDKSLLLNLVDFKRALKDCAIKLTDFQMSQIFGIFDCDRTGSINFEEFLVGVRGKMNARRRGVAKRAFDGLDPTRSGEADPEDIINNFSAAGHPDVANGQKTEDDILKEFLDTFDVGGVKDGKVVIREFMEYYDDVSSSIEDDDFFEAVLRSVWGLGGGEDGGSQPMSHFTQPPPFRKTAWADQAGE
jgi:Ca2+-binding EF-hand superfamily protein